MVYLPRILCCALIGGHVAPKDKYKSIVSFDLNGHHHCAGVLVDRTTVLTAAHCLLDINDINRVDLTLNRYEKFGRKEDVISLEPISWHNHPKYNKELGFSHDIAVIKIQPLDPSILIPKLKFDTGKFARLSTKVSLAGWGFTDLNEKTLPNILMEAVMPITTCGPTLKQINNYDDDTMVCAGAFNDFTNRVWRDEDFKSAQRGDSGGPLLYMEDGTPVLVGLVSHGVVIDNESKTLMPGFFTRISNPSIIAFIQQFLDGVYPDDAGFNK